MTSPGRMHQTDEYTNLLIKAQQGDQKSLRLLMEEFQKYVWRYLRKKFRDEEVIRDISQEVQLAMLKYLPAIKEPINLKSLVIKITIHKMYSYFRIEYKQQKIRLDMDNINEVELKEIPVEGGKLVTDEGWHTENKIDMERALAGLSDIKRQVLLLKMEGFKYEEIAEMLDISVSSVKMHVNRGTKKLKKFFLGVTFWGLAAPYIIEGLIKII